jgi:hypothetical protein
MGTLSNLSIFYNNENIQSILFFVFYSVEFNIYRFGNRSGCSAAVNGNRIIRSAAGTTVVRIAAFSGNSAVAAADELNGIASDETTINL